MTELSQELKQRMSGICGETFQSKEGYTCFCTKPEGHQERNPESYHSGERAIPRAEENKSEGAIP